MFRISSSASIDASPEKRRGSVPDLSRVTGNSSPTGGADLALVAAQNNSCDGHLPVHRSLVDLSLTVALNMFPKRMYEVARTEIDLSRVDVPRLAL